MTITDIIKALPLNEKIRMQILNMYPYMDRVDKFEVEKTAWQTYMKLYKERLQENIQLEMQEAYEGKRNIDKALYAKASEKTEQEMEQLLQEGQEKYDLSAARHAMQKIVDEINAAKLAKKARKH